MEAEDTSFFCIICGGPPTDKNVIKRSSLQYLTKQTKLASMRHLMITAIVEGNRSKYVLSWPLEVGSEYSKPT
jgi:hypothetical protein